MTNLEANHSEHTHDGFDDLGLDVDDASTDDAAPDDEPNLTDDSGSDDVDVSPEAAGPRQTQAAAKKRSMVAAYKRALRKRAELAAAPEATLRLLAASFGADPDVESVTLAVLTADRSGVDSMRALSQLRSIDRFDLGVELVSMGRPKLRAIWSTLEGLTGVPAEPLHISDAKAARQIAAALGEVEGPDWDTLEQAIELVSKAG